MGRGARWAVRMPKVTEQRPGFAPYEVVMPKDASFQRMSPQREENPNEIRADLDETRKHQIHMLLVALGCNAVGVELCVCLWSTSNAADIYHASM